MDKNSKFKKENSKFKTGANIFQLCLGKKKISSKKTTYWDKAFMGRKRNLWYENSNLRKDKEELLDENDDLFDENKQLKNDIKDLESCKKDLYDENDDLIDKNNRLRDDVDEINEKLSRKKEKYNALKKKNKVLHGENENLRKENENLSKQNNYMRDLLSWFGILFDKDGKQISNNIENQQMFSPFMLPFTGFDGSTNNGLFNNINKSSVGQKRKPMPKISSQPLQKE